MGTIVLARSGSTDFDEEQRITGTLDVPVNSRGQEELATMASRLLAFRPLDTIYSAAGESARDSAASLGAKLGVRVRVLDDLRNLDFGLWQGLPVAELRRKHRKVFKQWEESPCAICPPAGEMLEDLMSRVPHAIRPAVRKAHQGATVVLVVPDPLRQVIRCHLTAGDIAEIWKHASDEILEPLAVG